MIRLVLALAGALLLAACGEPEREWPEPKPALWEMVSPEGRRGWLFGTIHSLPLEVRWRTPALEGALANSGVLVVEVVDVGDTAKAESVFERFARNESLAPLSQRVAPEDRADFAAFLDRAGSGETDFATTDTWAAALMLANRARQLEAGQNVDRALVDVRSEVVGLESHAVQYALFDALPPEEQTDLLMALARDTGGEAARIEAWLTGDLAKLASEMEGTFLDQPALRQSLLVDRNAYFAARIVEAIERGRAPFVAVGAGHMLGPGGLPALLAARGYTVRRVQ